MTPTADHVAAAIVAACKETGADPQEVAMGVNIGPKGNRDGAAHARSYAGLALRCEFPDADGAALARMVGARIPKGFFLRLDKQINGNCKPPHWWSDDAYRRVIEAVAKVKAPIKALPFIKLKGRALGACVSDEVPGMGDRPADRPRAEQIAGERDGR